MDTMYYRNKSIQEAITEANPFKFHKHTITAFKIFVKYRIFDAALCWPLLAYAPNQPIKQNNTNDSIPTHIESIKYNPETINTKNFHMRDATIIEKSSLIDKLRN